MIILSTEAQNVAGTAIANLIDSGSVLPNGYIEIRTDVKPASPQVAATGSLLGTLQLSNPAYNTFANGIALINPITNAIAVSQGVATWFRVYNRNKAPVMDGDVTLTGKGGDIQLDNVNILVGGAIQINTLNGVMPAKC